MSENFQNRWGNIGENIINWNKIQILFSWIIYTKTMIVTLLVEVQRATNIKTFSEFYKVLIVDEL